MLVWFGDNVIIKDLNLTVEDQEFLVLVGPSGCGKTTALRLLIREFEPDGCVLVVPESAATIAAREFPDVRCITLPTEAASLVRDILPAWLRHRKKFSEDRF